MISFVLCLGKPVGREGEERAMRGIEQKTRYEHRYILGGRKGRTSDTVVLPSCQVVCSVTQQRHLPLAVPLQPDMEMASTMHAWAACFYFLLSFSLTM